MVKIQPTKFCLRVVAIVVLCIGIVGCQARPDNVRAGQIASSSMEPTLAGPRITYHCDNCNWSGFYSGTLDVSELRSDALVACARCGESAPAIANRKGELVRYRKVSDPSEIQIGQIVVFKSGDSTIDFQASPAAVGLQIKRVVALPNQSVLIQNGDLFVNGVRHTASLSEFYQRRIYIDSLEVETLSHSTGYKVAAWTVYKPKSLYPRIFKGAYRHASPVQDESFWDSEESRRFVTVDDLAIEIPLVPHVEELIRFELLYKGVLFETQITLQDGQCNYNVYVADRNIAVGSMQIFDQSALLIGFIDQRLLLGWTMSNLEATAIPLSDILSAFSNTKTTADSPSSEAPALSSQQPLAIMIQSDRVRAIEIKIFRDVQYRGPRGEGEYSFEPVAGYQVLGDNVSASLDSRQIYPHGIAAEQIVGILED